ncbi:MAG: hypothetical protein IJ367_03925, partial [Clostridia bacterium]|nr:hypothetical protein [Clostridia bacterium]
ETAKKYADFGFIRIVSDCKLEETEGGVELSFQKESFLNIAKMNQYDSILSKAILEVAGKDLRVKFRSAEENTTEGDSFRQLMSKLDGYQGKITFK